MTLRRVGFLAERRSAPDVPSVIVSVGLALLLVTGAVAAGVAALGFVSFESMATISGPVIAGFVATGGDCVTGGDCATDAPWLGDTYRLTLLVADRLTMLTSP